MGEKIKPLNEYENAILVVDEILGHSNRKHIDQFFMRGRQNSLDIHYISQPYFDETKRRVRKNTI